MLESSYKICRHCHQDINCATPHKRSQIPALASVQCRAVALVAAGAKLDQSDISRDRTNFPFPPPRHTSAADTGHGTHNPHQRQHSNIYGRKSNWIQQFLRKFSSKSCGSFHCPLHWCGMWRLHRGCWPCLYDHYNHRNGPICNFPDIGTIMFTDGGAATWCNNHQ